MTSPPKVMMIALDACEASIALDLAADGRAPNLAALLRDGTRAETEIPVGLYVGAIWPTFFTARQPSRHRYFSWEESEPCGRRHRLVSPRRIRGSHFWRDLSRQGRRVAIIDVPHTWIDGAIDGIQVVEWGNHDRHFGFQTWPPELAHEIEDRVGLHPVFGVDAYEEGAFAADDYVHRAGVHRVPHETRALVSDLLEGIDRKTRLSLEVLESGSWDCFLTVFGESHAVGHHCWHLRDTGHPSYDPDLVAALGGDPIELVYERLDAALGALVERAGAETAVVVLLSHGMGAHNDGTGVLAPLLRRLDEGTPTGTRRRQPKRLLRSAWLRLPPSLRRPLGRFPAVALRRRLRRDPAALPAPLPTCICGLVLPEPGASPPRWFALPNNDAHGAVRISMAGRDPGGIVDPRDVDRVLDDLSHDLLEIVNVETGAPIADAVLRTTDLYDREPDDDLPDLVVLWNTADPIKIAWSAKTGLVHQPFRGWRTGDHRPHGLVVARAPWLEAGRPADPVAIVDLAPTICSILGVELTDVDGRAIAQLVGPGAKI